MSLGTDSKQRLRYFVERIEALQEEQRALGGDVKDLLTTAKGEGFDARIIRKVLYLRRKSQTERQEEDAILDTYLHALGMLEGTPLGEWAKEKETA